MQVTALNELVIEDIGRAFGDYDYGGERGLIDAFPSRDAAAAQAVSDENAVHDHIDGVEQQPDHLGNGIFCKKSVRLAFIHGDAPP